MSDDEHWLRRGTELASDICKVVIGSCENKDRAFPLWRAIYDCLLKRVLHDYADRVKPFRQSDGREVPYWWEYNGRIFMINADPAWLTSWTPTHGASYRITEGEERIWVNSIEDVLNHIFSTGDVHTLTSPLDVLNYNPLEHCDSLPA